MWVLDFSIWQFFLILVAAFIGELQGSVLGGGGFFTQPALLAAGLTGHQAVANDVASAAVAAVASSYVFHRNKQINYDLFWKWVPGTVIGTVLGVIFLSFVPVSLIEKIIIVLSITGVIFILFFKPKETAPHIHIDLVSNVLMKSLVFSFIFGLYLGFSGAGSGILVTILLLIFFREGMKSSLGFKEAIHLVACLVAGACYWYQGWIVWEILIPLMIVTSIAAYIGANIVMFIPENYLKFVFILGALAFSTIALIN